MIRRWRLLAHYRVLPGELELRGNADSLVAAVLEQLDEALGRRDRLL
jgi:hypothetical protein